MWVRFLPGAQFGILSKHKKSAKLLCMSPDLEAEIAQIKRTVNENNKILKSIQSTHRWSMIIGVLKWVIYLGILIGAYSIIKPYLDQVISTYASIQESAGVMSDIRTSGVNNFESLRELFR